MNCDMEKKLPEHIGADVPGQLIVDLDSVVGRLGLVKKRAIAAALASFIHSETAEQMQAYQTVYEQYYSNELSTDDTSAADHAEAIVLEEGRKARDQARQTRQRKGA